jgi:hypothetical protein
MKPTRLDERAKPERPIPDAYWIIPGRLLAGPYPGSRREGMVRQRVLRFLAAGITLFLDLTEEGEMPPYAQWLDEAARHLRMPIPDFGVPAPEQMVQTLDVIDVAVGTRHAVYVHCLAGLGRTGWGSSTTTPTTPTRSSPTTACTPGWRTGRARPAPACACTSAGRRKRRSWPTGRRTGSTVTPRWPKSWAREQGCTVYDMWGAPDKLDESDPLWGVYASSAGSAASS